MHKFKILYMRCVMIFRDYMNIFYTIRKLIRISVLILDLFLSEATGIVDAHW